MAVYCRGPEEEKRAEVEARGAVSFRRGHDMEKELLASEDIVKAPGMWNAACAVSLTRSCPKGSWNVVQDRLMADGNHRGTGEEPCRAASLAVWSLFSCLTAKPQRKA